MTPEQAVAWLIIEGWVWAYDDIDSRITLVPADGTEEAAVKVYTSSSRPRVLGTIPWSLREWHFCCCPSKFPQYAADAVAYILEGEPS